MSGRDVVGADAMIFDRIRKSNEDEYGNDFTVDNRWRAMEMLLEGMRHDAQ